METKNLISGKIEKFGVLLLTFFFSALAFAQEKTPDLKVDVNTTKTTSTEQWMTNPLYWVIGALVLIVLIAVIARGGNNNRN